MRRNAGILAAGLAISAFQFGCSMMEKDDPSMSASAYDYDTTSDPTYASGEDYGSGSSTTYGGTDYGTYDSQDYDSAYTTTYPSSTSGTDSYDAAGAVGKYHTVARKETLYSLARMYYGDARKWKEIYQANQDTISDPNKIFVGQRLLIP